ncbi:MAG: hypothetical protein MJ178_10375 [Treponemataceae bacterium]|nr:hypothetical protein [Treponemataceae bacterium]
MNEKMSVFSSVDRDEISGMQAKLEKHGIASEIEKETVRYDDGSIADYDVYQLIVDISDYENNMHFIGSVVDEHFQISEDEQKHYEANKKDMHTMDSCLFAAGFSYLLAPLFIDIKNIIHLFPRKKLFAFLCLMITIGIISFFVLLIKNLVTDYHFFGVVYGVINLVALLVILIVNRLHKTDRTEEIND